MSSPDLRHSTEETQLRSRFGCPGLATALCAIGVSVALLSLPWGRDLEPSQFGDHFIGDSGERFAARNTIVAVPRTAADMATVRKNSVNRQ